MADGHFSSSSHPSVPRWDGDPGTIEDFAELTRYWVLGHKTEDRVYLGPRMLQVMDQKSQQYEEAKKVVLETQDLAPKIPAGFHFKFGPVHPAQALSHSDVLPWY